MLCNDHFLYSLIELSWGSNLVSRGFELLKPKKYVRHILTETSLLLLVKHNNPLEIASYSFFCGTFLEYQEICSKKLFYIASDS